MRNYKIFILIVACLCAFTFIKFNEANRLTLNKEQHSFNKEKSSGWVKFFVVRGHIFFPVYINKNRKKVFAMLDTGTQKTIIPENMQKIFDISSYGNPRIIGYSGILNGKFGSPINIRIGKSNYHIKQPLLLPIDKYLKEMFNINSNMIIVGSNILKKILLLLIIRLKRFCFHEKKLLN
jgi:hypothetical protein